MIGSDHQGASISSELFSPDLLNQLSTATPEEGILSPSHNHKLDVSSLFSDMFQSSYEHSIENIMQHQVSQSSRNRIVTKVCDLEWREKNIALQMLRKQTWNDIDFKSAILLAFKDALMTNDNQSDSNDVSSVDTNDSLKEDIKDMIGKLFVGFFKIDELQNSQELWISFLKLFFTIRYPYVEISSYVMSHAAKVSTTLTKTVADKRGWIRVLFIAVYVPCLV